MLESLLFLEFSIEFFERIGKVCLCFCVEFRVSFGDLLKNLYTVINLIKRMTVELGSGNTAGAGSVIIQGSVKIEHRISLFKDAGEDGVVLIIAAYGEADGFKNICFI